MQLRTLRLPGRRTVDSSDLVRYRPFLLRQQFSVQAGVRGFLNRMVQRQLVTQPPTKHGHGNEENSECCPVRKPPIWSSLWHKSDSPEDGRP